MSMNDITIIYLTVNKVPDEWAKFQRGVLKEAIGDTKIISVSSEPIDFGTNIIQKPPYNASNIYRQMLKAMKMADTEYIAVAEDDVLYPEEHFKKRPKGESFLYNMSRWAILTWGDPIYFYRHRISNLTLIAPRKLAIQCLEERFKKWPDDTGEFAAGELGKERVQERLGLPKYNLEYFHSASPVLNFAHVGAIDKTEQTKRKTIAKSLLSYDIPVWGRADDIINYFK